METVFKDQLICPLFRIVGHGMDWWYIRAHGDNRSFPSPRDSDVNLTVNRSEFALILSRAKLFTLYGVRHVATTHVFYGATWQK